MRTPFSLLLVATLAACSGSLGSIPSTRSGTDSGAAANMAQAQAPGTQQAGSDGGAPSMPAPEPPDPATGADGGSPAPGEDASTPGAADSGTAQAGTPQDRPDWHEDALPPATPSANAGRVGETYLVSGDTFGMAGHNYWVYAPDSAATTPAGIYLFFHGCCIGSDDEVQWFHNMTPILEDQNLIGINMSYVGNDYPSRADEVSMAAEYALSQVMADYKVVAGRGVGAAFSAGGGPLSRLVARHGGWPFSHVTGFSAVYNQPAPTPTEHSWVFAVGQLEWSSYGLGDAATARVGELEQAMDSGGSLDLYLNVEVDRGHAIPFGDDAVAGTMAAADRSFRLFAPFVYAPDYPEPELFEVVQSAQALRLGHALEHVAGVKDLHSAGPIRDKADLLQARIEERVSDVLSLLASLAADDPVLGSHYMERALPQLARHPREAELRGMLDAVRSDPQFDAIQGASEQWYQNVGGYLDGSGNLLANKVAEVQQIQSAVPASSLVGQMAAQYLLLAP